MGFFDWIALTDRLSVSTYEPGQIKTLWQRHHPKFLARDRQIETIRKLYAGELKIPLPAEFAVQGREYLEFGLPTKWMMALHLTTVLQEKVAKLRRDGGTNPAAAQRATTVELWCNAAIERTLDQDTLTDLLLNEAEAGLVVALDEASWDDRYDFLTRIKGDQYNALGPAERKGYAALGGDYVEVDAKGEPLPRKRFQVDKNGNPPKPGQPFTMDDTASRKYHADELKDFRSRHFPFTCRVIAADDCLPIYGANLALEGLLVRCTYTREKLLERKYRWDEEGDLMSPAGNPDRRSMLGQGEVLTLYEAYLLDPDGKPYCVYEVDGNTTYIEDDNGRRPAVVDLYAEFGLTRLPAAYGYGLHFARSNLANRGAPMGVPFAWPLIGVLLMKEMVACGISIKTWWSGFPGYVFKPDESMLQTHPELLLENDAPRDFALRPMSVTSIPGDIQPLVSPGLGAEVGAVMNLLNEAIADYGPNPTASGNAGATGVSDRSLIDEQIRRAHAPVLKTRRLMVQAAAEIILEYGTKWSARQGQPLPIHADIPVPTLNGRGGRKVTKRGVVEIDEDTVGDNYSLTAYYPREFGDNLARTQQILESWKDGASSWREMREVGFEDEAPEETLVELILDKFYQDDKYRAEILADALQANGDTQLAEKMRLEAQGTARQDGLPVDAMAGVEPQPGMTPPPGPPAPPPMGPGGAPTVNMALPNPGLSQLGGLVGAQQQAAQAVAGPAAGG